MILHFPGQGRPETVHALDALPAQGFVWLDLVRGRAEGWATTVQRWTGVTVHTHHLSDGVNEEHPSYADRAEGYEMLIFRSLAPSQDPSEVLSRPTAFFLFDRVLVTVRAEDSRSVHDVQERLRQGQFRVPERPVGLMHLILHHMVDRFLVLRRHLAEQMERWSEELLDPKDPFNDWQMVMRRRDRLLRLELLCDGQLDAVDSWRNNSSTELDASLAVRFNDLLEHVRRVQAGAQHAESQIEALVQMHFSATAHRTNEIVRVLTVVSVIFLPLGFLTGLFGMNLADLPAGRYGFYWASGGMVMLTGGLLLLFKRKGWI